jgi:hypothetical protein
MNNEIIMTKKHYRSSAKFFKVISIGLVIIALQVNTVKAQVSFITNGQSIQATNSWDIKLVDINGDGNLDAYFGSKTWLNDGNGNISETNLSFGSGIFASFGDLNGDGFVDVVCQDSIYLNDGDNHYEFKIKLSSDIAMYSSVLADVDNDGDIDIISCSTTKDRILFNDGKANFTNSGISLGGWAQASYAFGDINSDGFIDIYVAIPHTPPPTMKHSANKIWFGSAEKKFTEKSHDISAAVSRNAILCDFDNDGDMDLFLASNGETGNMIFFNDGKGNFKDSGQVLGNNSGAAKTADFDGDGDFDLFICYGKVPMGNGAPNKVWHNDGQGQFTDNKLSLGNSNSAAIALGDMNKDGKIDAVIVNIKLDPKNSYASAPCPVEIWLNKPLESNTINETDDAYFGLTPPGLTPEVFARGIVSTSHLEHSAPRFSPDGTEVFWELVQLPIVEGISGKMIMTMQHSLNGWSKPTETEDFPVFTSDGKRFYFSDLPQASKNNMKTEKENNSENLTNYIHLIAQYPELKYTRGLSIADNRNIYFMSYLEGPMNGYGIYRAEFINGEYAKPEPLPSSINKADFLNWTPFIAPDESYLLFSSNRQDEAGDLYISLRLTDESWTNPVNLGETINSPNQERFPMLSPDGKYLFFTRPTAEYHQDVFWVSAGIIEELRKKTIKKIDL